MALDAGSITVDSDGNATGTGLAIDIFNGALSGLATDRRQLIAAAIAPYFQGFATAIVNHLIAHAQVAVTVHTTDTGLQTTTALGAPTNGPAANHTLTGGLT